MTRALRGHKTLGAVSGLGLSMREERAAGLVLAANMACAICLALVLTGCEEIKRDLKAETPQIPRPVTLPGGHAERVSGALKPGGGQPVQAGGGRGALRTAEIIEGTPGAARRRLPRPRRASRWG